MSEFKSRRVFNEEPASKENHCMGGAQRAKAYWSDFRWEKCERLVYWEILKNKTFPQFTAMKKFLKFWFQQDGAKAYTADLTLNLVETHFKKRVILNRFPLKKKGGLELAAVQTQSQSFRHFLWGYVKYRCYANKPTTKSIYSAVH